MTKPTKWHACPAKTQISLSICPDWSVSSLSTWRKLGSLATRWAHRQVSDQTRQMPFCWFCHEVAHFVNTVISPIVLRHTPIIVFLIQTFKKILLNHSVSFLFSDSLGYKINVLLKTTCPLWQIAFYLIGRFCSLLCFKLHKAKALQVSGGAELRQAHIRNFPTSWEDLLQPLMVGPCW